MTGAVQDEQSSEEEYRWLNPTCVPSLRLTQASIPQDQRVGARKKSCRAWRRRESSAFTWVLLTGVLLAATRFIQSARKLRPLSLACKCASGPCGITNPLGNSITSKLGMTGVKIQVPRSCPGSARAWRPYAIALCPILPGGRLAILPGQGQHQPFCELDGQ
jgi:hypothetical protein